MAGMRPEGHVYLIGYRATGKSTLAPLLAERLALPCIDLDARLARVHRRTISELWETWGEPYFRTQETILLTELSANPPTVFSTGGGVVIDPSNRELMRGTGFCVWLRATPETIGARLASDAATATSRPPLDPALDRDEEVAVTLARREPLYAEMAAGELWTDDRPLPALVDALEALVAQLRAAD